VVALHLCFDAITNRDEFINALGPANVILVLGGHYHQSKADIYRGVRFLQLPSPAPNGQGEVMVVRITSDRLLALPYSYREKQWENRRGVIENVPIRGPRLGRPAGSQTIRQIHAPDFPIVSGEDTAVGKRGV
jgi:hypothetical protein